MSINLMGTHSMATKRTGERLTADDYVAIQQLYLRYSAAVDFRDIDTWLTTWTETPEPSMVAHDGRVFAGRDALYAAAVKQRDDSGDVGYHWTNSPLIQETEYGASGMCYVMNVHAVGVADSPIYSYLPQGRLQYVMHYEDELVKQDGRWRFRKRSAHALHP